MFHIDSFISIGYLCLVVKRKLSIDEIKKTTLLPLFPLNTVLFPHGVLPLHVFEERYRTLIDRCLQAEETFGVVLIKSGSEVGGSSIPHSIGTEATITHYETLDDGRFYILATGRRRFSIARLDYSQPYLSGRVTWISDDKNESINEEVRLLASRLVLDYVQYLQTIWSKVIKS